MTHSATVHIPSGTFRVSEKKPETYQAFLGTCVGVALYDRMAGVGGMIHILLPEPSSELAPEYPEKYASTGLPMMIRELYKLGADRENLTATIAGGALVGPLSQLDINLDIGGRSTEIANALVEKEGIRILKSETGGFFTCTLELDMTTGETRIKPAWEERNLSDFNYASPTPEDILNTIETLQPIPQAALKIMRMMQYGENDMKSITDELSKDQVLGARTLQLCNSAMFAGRVRIETLSDATLLLGESHLIRSVITAAIRGYFRQTGASGYSLCKGGIFFHAVGCGMTAEKIAAITGKANPNSAYTAGLLHDIGRVVLDQYIARACPLFFRGVHKLGESSLAMEKKILGTTHCNTGSILAKKWNFSEALSESILYHHNPEQALKHKNLVRIIYLADLLMSRFNVGLEIENLKTVNLSTVLSNLGLSVSDLPGLIDAIPLTIFDTKSQL
ncbi:MAG: HDOD domain-containing protein [Pseudomonadota bacterium]